MMAASDSTRVPLPSRNPLPLSATQEGQVREIYYKRVRNLCADEIRGKLPPRSLFYIAGRCIDATTADFASCALNRTFSATWKCRPQRLAMNSCMIGHAGQEQQDAAREEWFATRDERIRQKQEKEARKKEQEKFHREWWGLPPVEESGPEGGGGKGETV